MRATQPLHKNSLSRHDSVLEWMSNEANIFPARPFDWRQLELWCVVIIRVVSPLGRAVVPETDDASGVLMIGKLEEVIAHLELLVRTVTCPKGSGCCCVNGKVWSAYRPTSISIGLTDDLLCYDSGDVDCVHRVNSSAGASCQSEIRVYKSKALG